MTCEHLRNLEQAILSTGIRETYRGQAWSMNCREWVYFDTYLDLPATRQSFPLESCVQDHDHRGTHDGSERGLICATCHDALMGTYDQKLGRPIFPKA